MEVYKRETREILRRFLAHNLSFPHCIAALDAALAGLLPRLQPEQLDDVRAVMLTNNDTVMKEMERRGKPSKTPRPIELSTVTRVLMLPMGGFCFREAAKQRTE